MTTSDQLRQAWIALEAEEETLPGNYERRVFAQATCAIYAGLVRPSRQLKLIISVPSPIATEGLERTTRGFQVVRQRLAQERNTRVSLELTQTTFRELFEVMAEDVAGSVAAATDHGSAVEAMRHRLNHWERFMKAAGPDGLDRARQMGLFGELIFLQTLLDAGVPPIDALGWWLGPTRANQDFQAGNRAVEVKTTAGNSATMLKIANELQLDDADCESLHLFHLWLRDVTGDGATLPQLIDEIAQRFSGHAAQLFLDRLADAGYHEVHRTLYADAGYVERQRRYYEVRDEFPRIRRTDLRPGVSHADYSIDLSGFATYMRDEANVITTLHGGKDE
jgi:hypothetical protein